MLKFAKNVFIYNLELLLSSVLNPLNSQIEGFYDFMLKSNSKKKKKVRPNWNVWEGRDVVSDFVAKDNSGTVFWDCMIRNKWQHMNNDNLLFDWEYCTLLLRNIIKC